MERCRVALRVSSTGACRSLSAHHQSLSLLSGAARCTASDGLLSGGSAGERLLPRQIAAVARLRDPVKTIHQLAHAQLGKVENRDPVMLREADRHPGATLDPSRSRSST